MTLKTTLLFVAGLAAAAAVQAQTLPLTTTANLFRPEGREISKLIEAPPQPAPVAHEVRFTVLTVKKAIDRARVLQLTLGSDPGPALTPPPTELRGQALMTVHVRVATTFAP